MLWYILHRLLMFWLYKNISHSLIAQHSLHQKRYRSLTSEERDKRQSVIKKSPFWNLSLIFWQCVCWMLECVFWEPTSWAIISLSFSQSLSLLRWPPTLCRSHNAFVAKGAITQGHCYHHRVSDLSTHGFLQLVTFTISHNKFFCFVFYNSQCLPHYMMRAKIRPNAYISPSSSADNSQNEDWIFMSCKTTDWFIKFTFMIQYFLFG